MFPLFSLAFNSILYIASLNYWSKIPNIDKYSETLTPVPFFQNIFYTTMSSTVI